MMGRRLHKFATNGCKAYNAFYHAFLIVMMLYEFSDSIQCNLFPLLGPFCNPNATHAPFCRSICVRGLLQSIAGTKKSWIHQPTQKCMNRKSALRICLFISILHFPKHILFGIWLMLCSKGKCQITWANLYAIFDTKFAKFMNFYFEYACV